MAPASTTSSDPDDGVRSLLRPALTEREKQLLAATLEVLRDTGYDRLTIDKVVARARASKTTVYRRWPSKADLVAAAFANAVRSMGIPEDTGSLRGDLLALADAIAADAELFATIGIGILAAPEASSGLRDLLVGDLRHDRRDQIHGVLRRAVARGEIVPGVISDDIWDVLPAYISFRVLYHGRAVSRETLTAIVDDVMLPSLTRIRPDEASWAAQ
jgi:AcrR family transcriptional regulator